ncbi:MAG: hypothetical protein M1818_006748 [Claussenomyces sp. TS43310]|nr:MAG: hypothetical protein M1818_006748 [Claussenomyces sp. TS43310]
MASPAPCTLPRTHSDIVEHHGTFPQDKMLGATNGAIAPQTMASRSPLSQSKKRKLDHEHHDHGSPRKTYQRKKTKAPAEELGGSEKVPAAVGFSPRKSRKNVAIEEPVEKRLRAFRKHAPRTFLERLDRVRTQRMYLIDRTRRMSADGTHQEEVFDIAGTTGNIYSVNITKAPSCTCPDNVKGNQCKHIVYVLVHVLKTPEHLSYQLAFLSTELQTIFAGAPTTPQSLGRTSATASAPGKRRPVEGDCPVCVMEFEAGEDIVWCRASCGNNIHRQCFETWARSKPGEVRCVYCRTPWSRQGSEEVLKRARETGEKNADGYVNITTELGLSGERDMSSYHPFWVRQRYGFRDYDYEC